jgi:hypothetical protein
VPQVVPFEITVAEGLWYSPYAPDPLKAHDHLLFRVPSAVRPTEGTRRNQVNMPKSNKHSPPESSKFEVVLFQRTVVLLSFYVLSLLIVKVSHRDDPVRDAIRTR